LFVRKIRIIDAKNIPTSKLSKVCRRKMQILVKIILIFLEMQDHDSI